MVSKMVGTLIETWQHVTRVTSHQLQLVMPAHYLKDSTKPIFHQVLFDCVGADKAIDFALKIFQTITPPPPLFFSFKLCISMKQDRIFI